MSFERFFTTIDNSPIGKLVARKKELVAQTDPERIFVENVRSFFNWPYSMAKLACDLAVREKVFLHRTAYLCKNEDCKRILVVTAAESEDIVTCEICEALERNQFQFHLKELEPLDLYSLSDLAELGEGLVDRKQAEVYRLLADVLVKFVLGIATAVVFVGLAVVLIFWPSWPAAVAEGCVAFAVRRVFTHHFPARQN